MGDEIAARGVHLRNAFVTTSLCSPSRATILTGLYAHQHKVVDNNPPVPAGTTFFPQYLQRRLPDRARRQVAPGRRRRRAAAGIRPLGELRGAGQLPAVTGGPEREREEGPAAGYISDELTDYTLEWLRGRDRARPFFLYLSHKGVHNDYVPATRSSDSIPAERHRGRLESAVFTPPKSMR